MEGIPFIIVERVPKGESGAESKYIDNWPPGVPLSCSTCGPKTSEGCRVSPISGLPLCLSSLALPGAGSPMRPQLPLGAGAAGTAIGRKDHGPLPACWRDGCACAMNRLPRPALLPEVLPDLSVRRCGWQSGTLAGSQRALPSPPLFSSQPEVLNAWRTCAYSPGLPLRSQLGSPWKEGVFIGTLRHEGRSCACRCESWTCSESDSISFTRSCLAYLHPPTGASSHSGWGLLSLPSPCPHLNIYCMWSP